MRLVNGDKLSDKKAQLTGEPATLIYALAPRKQAPDALGLHVQSIEQSRQLLKGVVQGDQNRSVRSSRAAAACVLWDTLQQWPAEPDCLQNVI